MITKTTPPKVYQVSGSFINIEAIAKPTIGHKNSQAEAFVGLSRSRDIHANEAIIDAGMANQTTAPTKPTSKILAAG